jgi:hypothetical protein
MPSAAFLAKQLSSKSANSNLLVKISCFAKSHLKKEYIGN